MLATVSKLVKRSSPIWVVTIALVAELFKGWGDKRSLPRAEILGAAFTAIGLPVAPEVAFRIADRLEARGAVKRGGSEAAAKEALGAYGFAVQEPSLEQLVPEGRV